MGRRPRGWTSHGRSRWRPRLSSCPHASPSPRFVRSPSIETQDTLTFLSRLTHLLFYQDYQPSYHGLVNHTSPHASPATEDGLEKISEMSRRTCALEAETVFLSPRQPLPQVREVSGKSFHREQRLSLRSPLCGLGLTHTLTNEPERFPGSPPLLSTPVPTPCSTPTCPPCKYTIVAWSDGPRPTVGSAHIRGEHCVAQGL